MRDYKITRYNTRGHAKVGVDDRAGPDMVDNTAIETMFNEFETCHEGDVVLINQLAGHAGRQARSAIKFVQLERRVSLFLELL